MEPLDKLLLSESREDNRLGVHIGIHKFKVDGFFWKVTSMGIRHMYFSKLDEYTWVLPTGVWHCDGNRYIKIPRPDVRPKKYRPKYKNR